MKLPEYLSNGRSYLMGVAILLVIFHHMSLPTTSPIITFIKINGGIGVDLFFILSGFGLVNSYGNNSTKKFFLNRLIRIIPFYALIVVFFNLLHGDFNIIVVLLQISTIGYWIGYEVEWYVPVLLLLYLLFPIYYRLCVKCKWGSLFIIIGLYFLLYLLPSESNFQVIRSLPIFLLGVQCNTTLKNIEINNKYFISIIFILFSIGLCFAITHFCHFRGVYGESFYEELKKTGWLFKPYFLVTPALCYVLISIKDMFRKKRGISKLLKYIEVIGLCSYELYLIHLQFFYIARLLCNSYGLNKILIPGIFLVLSFVTAYYFNKINLFVSRNLKQMFF